MTFEVSTERCDEQAEMDVSHNATQLEWRETKALNRQINEAEHIGSNQWSNKLFTNLFSDKVYFTADTNTISFVTADERNTNECLDCERESEVDNTDTNYNNNLIIDCTNIDNKHSLLENTDNISLTHLSHSQEDYLSERAKMWETLISHCKESQLPPLTCNHANVKEKWLLHNKSNELYREHEVEEANNKQEVECHATQRIPLTEHASNNSATDACMNKKLRDMTNVCISRNHLYSLEKSPSPSPSPSPFPLTSTNNLGLNLTAKSKDIFASLHRSQSENKENNAQNSSNGKRKIIFKNHGSLNDFEKDDIERKSVSKSVVTHLTHSKELTLNEELEKENHHWNELSKYEEEEEEELLLLELQSCNKENKQYEVYEVTDVLENKSKIKSSDTIAADKTPLIEEKIENVQEILTIEDTLINEIDHFNLQKNVHIEADDLDRESEAECNQRFTKTERETYLKENEDLIEIVNEPVNNDANIYNYKAVREENAERAVNKTKESCYGNNYMSHNINLLQRVCKEGQRTNSRSVTVSVEEMNKLTSELNKYKTLYICERNLAEEKNISYNELYSNYQQKILENISLKSRGEENKRFIRQLKREIGVSRTHVMDVSNKILTNEKEHQMQINLYEERLAEIVQIHEEEREEKALRIQALEQLIKDLSCLRLKEQMAEEQREDDANEELQEAIAQNESLRALLKASYVKNTMLFDDIVRQAEQLQLLETKCQKLRNCQSYTIDNVANSYKSYQLLERTGKNVERNNNLLKETKNAKSQSNEFAIGSNESRENVSKANASLSVVERLIDHINNYEGKNAGIRSDAQVNAKALSNNNEEEEITAHTSEADKLKNWTNFKDCEINNFNWSKCKRLPVKLCRSSDDNNMINLQTNDSVIFTE